MKLKDLKFENLKKKNKEELAALKKKALNFLLESRFKKIFSSLDNSNIISLTKKGIARIETLIKKL